MAGYTDYSSLDLLDLLDELNLEYSTSGKNIGQDYVGIYCPYCGDDRGHGGLHIHHKWFSCFKCGTTASLLSYLKQEVGFKKAQQTIEELLPRELKQSLQEVYQSSVDIVNLPVMAKEGLLPHHKQYLIDRGYDPDVLVDRYHLHCVDYLGEFSNSIIVPIFKRHKLVTFTSISILEDVENRYIHLSKDKSIAHVKDILCFTDRIKNGTVYVVEGHFDAFRIDGVPLFGVKYTQAQVRELAKYRRVVIVADGDSSGWDMARSLSTELAPFTEVSYIDLPEGIDPDDLSENQVKQIKEL